MIKRIIRLILRKIIINKNKLTKYDNRGLDLLISLFINDYKKYSIKECLTAHNYGYSVEDYNILKINKYNYNEYLSTVKYYSIHPYNGEYSKWIDDKLTLKYLCSNSILNEYMPKYYFQIDNGGGLLSLNDYHGNKKTIDAIIDLLEKNKELAIKKESGSIGEGFYKAEYKNNNYYLNNIEYDRCSLKNKISKLRNYIVMEYLHPHPYFDKYCSKNTNTIRYLCGKTKDDVLMIKSFIRFGTNKSGEVENYNAGGILCYIDEKGWFNQGNIIINGNNKIIYNHIDTNVKLSGRIPMWSKIQKAVNDFCQYFPQLSYLGFDFVVTSDKRVIILEINSLSSLDALQLDGSILTSKVGNFYKERMNI